MTRVNIIDFIARKLKALVGIVQDTDTATVNIAKGKYVIWKGNPCKASSAISSGGTLSASNLTALTEGVGNDINSKVENLITWAYIEGTTTASGNLRTDLTFDNSNYYYVVACVTYDSGGWNVKHDVMTTPIIYSTDGKEYVGFNIRSIVSPYNAVGNTSVRISFGYILRH